MSAPALEAPRLRPVVRSLVLVESMRILRNPIFLVGVALSVALTYAFVENITIGGSYLTLSGTALLPVGLGAFVAVNLAALRSRRHGTEELYASLVAPASARTLALAGAADAAGAVAAMLVGIGFVAFGAADGLAVQPDGAEAVPALSELAQGPVAVAMLGVLGLALARWIPFLPAAPVVAVALLVVQTPLTTWNAQQPWAWLAPVVNTARTSEGSSWPCAADQQWPCVLERFATDLAAWHLAYLLGLGVLFVVAALARDARSPRLLAPAVAGAALAVVGGILQLP